MFVITYYYITYEFSSAVLLPALTHLHPVHQRLARESIFVTEDDVDVLLTWI